MDEFLAEYQKAGNEPTHLKALVTVHNMKWSVSGLYAELKKRTDCDNDAGKIRIGFEK